MKKLLLLLLLIPLVSFGQLEIEKPEGWFDKSPKTLDENVKKIFTKKIADILKVDSNKKEAIPLKIFTKYDGNNYGVSPTINVVLLKNINNYNLEDINNASKNSGDAMTKAGLLNYDIKYSKFTLVDNKRAVETYINFNIPNFKTKIRNKTYMFFINEMYYIQMSFMDTQDDNCENIFKKVLNSVKTN
jgi:hypothetical protein